MKDYRLTPAAKSHLMDIWDYTALNWSEEKADDYLKKIDLKLCELAGCPLIGKHRPEIAPGYYSFPIEKHIAFYLIQEGGIDVIGVLHERMDIPSRLK